MSVSDQTASQCAADRGRAAWPLFACTALVLGGCMATPLPDLRVDLPEHWQNAPAAGLAPAPLPDPRGWWRSFGDPELDALIEQALDANLDIAQARARLRAARTLDRHADAPLRPDLHLRTSEPIDPDASASFFVAGFDSVWEVGLFGRRAATHRVARADLDAANAELRQARVSVSAEVAREWIELRAAQQREALLVQIRDARDVEARRVEARLRLALATPQQAALARVAVAQAEAALTEPRIAVQAAAQALAVLLGRSEPAAAWMKPGKLPRLGEWRMASAPADLLRTRPDIARDEAAVLRAAGELGIATANQYPSISLEGSVVWSTSELEQRPTVTNRIAAFGPAIDIPLFDWGMRRAQADAKGAALEAAALAYRKTVLTAVSEVETALATLEQQRLRRLAAAQAWQALGEVAERTQRRRQLGLASGLDTAASAIEHEQAALQLMDARAAHALAYIALCKALGAAERDRVVTDTGEPG